MILLRWMVCSGLVAVAGGDCGASSARTWVVGAPLSGTRFLTQCMYWMVGASVGTFSSQAPLAARHGEDGLPAPVKRCFPRFSHVCQLEQQHDRRHVDKATNVGRANFGDKPPGACASMLADWVRREAPERLGVIVRDPRDVLKSESLFP